MEWDIIAHFTLQSCLVQIKLKHNHSTSNKLKLQYTALNGNC